MLLQDNCLGRDGVAIAIVRQMTPAASSADQAAAVEAASLALVEMTLAAVAAADGVSTLQLRMLVVLDRLAPLTRGALAEQLEVSTPSASRLVDRMVEAGLVRRDEAAHSRREVSLAATAQGRRALRSLRRTRERAIGGVLDRMTAADRAALVAGLDAFARAADE
jgi:DNA-binding MarR family transcriptional regulator